jgi:hypothetical protein
MRFDGYELLFCLYQLCCDYHSGQGSRGYRIMSRISRRGIKIVDSNELRDSECYLYLESRYRDRL